ncbi:SDR family NAD(P)-dependent oxidoreductase, partial [Rubrivirga sp.]|uniref:SDR family NAD(P)-dependent oxidoreductase n=1 Tax=Rubrivirga sp. TaxID=1885344 RepID=UPI003C76D1B3
MPPPLAGRRALVTGCSRRVGIGFAIADRLASLGADLEVHAFRPYDAEMPWGADGGGLEPLLDELRRHGTDVHGLEDDLAAPGAPERVVASASNRQVGAAGPHLDIVVANHTYSTMGGLGDLEGDEIDRHLAVNVRATLLLVQAFAAQHDDRPGGRVVLLTSGQQSAPMPGELAYVASKGALVPLAKSLSAALAPRGVTVNAVNPGATD